MHSIRAVPSMWQAKSYSLTAASRSAYSLDTVDQHAKAAQMHTPFLVHPACCQSSSFTSDECTMCVLCVCTHVYMFVCVGKTVELARKRAVQLSWSTKLTDEYCVRFINVPIAISKLMAKVRKCVTTASCSRHLSSLHHHPSTPTAIV